MGFIILKWSNKLRIVEANVITSLCYEEEATVDCNNDTSNSGAKLCVDVNAEVLSQKKISF